MNQVPIILHSVLETPPGPVGAQAAVEAFPQEMGEARTHHLAVLAHRLGVTAPRVGQGGLPPTPPPTAPRGRTAAHVEIWRFFVNLSVHSQAVLKCQKRHQETLRQSNLPPMPKKTLNLKL